MSIEIKFNSVVLQSEDLQEKYPGLISIVNSYLPAKKSFDQGRSETYNEYIHNN